MRYTPGSGYEGYYHARRPNWERDYEMSRLSLEVSGRLEAKCASMYAQSSFP